MFEINLSLRLSSIGETLGSLASYAGGSIEKASPYFGQAFTSIKNFWSGPVPEPIKPPPPPPPPPKPELFESAKQTVANALAAQTGFSLLGHDITVGETAVALIALYIAGKYILIPVAKKLMRRSTSEIQPVRADSTPPSPKPKDTSPRSSEGDSPLPSTSEDSDSSQQPSSPSEGEGSPPSKEGQSSEPPRRTTSKEPMTQEDYLRTYQFLFDLRDKPKR